MGITILKKCHWEGNCEVESLLGNDGLNHVRGDRMAEKVIRYVAADFFHRSII